MRLLVASHTPHYRRGGIIVGWGPTVREIDHLASLFEEVVHLAPLHDGSAPESAIPYESPRVIVVSVPAAGGSRFSDKFRVLQAWPVYLRTLLKELRASDVVHVRCPANISLLAVLLLSLTRRPEKRWIKYAGNWQPGNGEPWSYTLQRFLLSSTLHRAAVTVNGSWPGQPDHVRSFPNPCLTDQEIEEGKNAETQKYLTSPVRLLFVGRLEASKGCSRALKILLRLRQLGLSASLDIVGDGPEANEVEAQAVALGTDGAVRFWGALPRASLPAVYAASHILVFPSSSEGWPKVLSEGMAFGVVPLAGDVGSVSEYLNRFRTGRALPAEDVERFAQAILWYRQNPEEWKRESVRGMRAAADFSYTRYLTRVRDLLKIA